MASVQGTQPDQSWGLSLPGGFHQEVQPTLYDVNFLLPRPNPLIPAVISQNTVGASYDRGYIDLPPTRKETTRQYITDPSSYVQDLHPFGLGGGTGGVDNLSMLNRFGHPLPYADNEATEEIGFLAKRESALERVDPLSNGYAAQILGVDGKMLLKRHEINKENIAKRDAALAARAELTLKNGMAIHGKKADIGAANQIASESAAAIDRAATVEIARRARLASIASTAATAAATATVTRSTHLVEDDEEETKDDQIGLAAGTLPSDRESNLARYRELARQQEEDMRNAPYLGNGDDQNPDSGGATAGTSSRSFEQNYQTQSEEEFMTTRMTQSVLYDNKNLGSTEDSRRASTASTVVPGMSAVGASNSYALSTPSAGGLSSAATYSTGWATRTPFGLQHLVSTSQNAAHTDGVNQSFDPRLSQFKGNQKASRPGPDTIDLDTGADSNTNVQLIRNLNANRIMGASPATPYTQSQGGALTFSQLEMNNDPSLIPQDFVNYMTPRLGDRTNVTPGQGLSNTKVRSVGMTDTPHMTASHFENSVGRLNNLSSGLRVNGGGPRGRIIDRGLLGTNVLDLNSTQRAPSDLELYQARMNDIINRTNNIRRTNLRGGPRDEP